MRVYHDEVIAFATEIITAAIKDTLEGNIYPDLIRAVQARIEFMATSSLLYISDDVEAVCPVLSKLLDTKIEL